METLLGTYFNAGFIQIKLRKISYIRTLFKVWFIQDSGLFTVSLDRFHCI